MAGNGRNMQQVVTLSGGRQLCRLGERSHLLYTQQLHANVCYTDTSQTGMHVYSHRNIKQRRNTHHKHTTEWTIYICRNAKCEDIVSEQSTPDSLTEQT